MKMHFRKWLFIALTVALLQVDLSSCATCSDLVHPMVRTFHNLSLYQGNKQPFDPMIPESAGNYVEIEEVKSGLERNDFVTYQSDFIMRMDLGGKGIKSMENNTFLGLHCLRYLDLEQNQLSELPSLAFKELTLLSHLNLSGNNLKDLPGDLFTGLHRLKDLDLSHNSLTALSRDLFRNISDMQHLNLSYNKLTFLHFEDWKSMNALAIVDLSFNEMHSVEFPSTFFFGELTRLFLNDNKFKDLNVFSMTNKIPHLALLSLDNNPFACDDLAYILRGLSGSHVKYDGINRTSSNLGGIDCKDFSVFTILPTTPVAPPLPNIKINADSEILEAISNLKALVICLLVIFVMTIAVLILSQTGYNCNRLFPDSRRTTESYGNVENIRLIP